MMQDEVVETGTGTDNRRIDQRLPAAAVPTITALKLSPGDYVDLVNISQSGVLVEGKTRFVPGTRVTVSFEGGFTPTQIRAKVVRCQVAAIAGGALRYQSGIVFDQRIELPEANPPQEEPAAGLEASAAPPAPALAEQVLEAAAAPRIVNRW
jgi:PilZ domain